MWEKCVQNHVMNPAYIINHSVKHSPSCHVFLLFCFLFLRGKEITQMLVQAHLHLLEQKNPMCVLSRSWKSFTWCKQKIPAFKKRETSHIPLIKNEGCQKCRVLECYFSFSIMNSYKGHPLGPIFSGLQ